MAKSVSFLVEERRFDFSFDVLSANEIKEKFMEFAENDPNLRDRVEKTPLFYIYSPKLHKDVELSESSVIHNGHTIRVKLQDSVENDTVGNNTDTEKDTLRFITDVELGEIGIRREIWEALPTILKQRELNLLEQHKLMVSMGYVDEPYKSNLSEASVNQPKRSKKPRNKTTNKEQNMDEVPFRRCSKRLNNDKENVNPNTLAERELESSEQEIQEEYQVSHDNLVSNSSTTTPLAPSSGPQRKMGKRKALSKITKFTALPNFSSGLKNTILTKKNLTKTEKMLLISEVENHLILITGDSYLSPKEWEIVSDTIAEKYPNLQNTDEPGQSNELRHSLQTSIVARRYRRNKKERKQSETDEVSTDEPHASSTSDTNTDTASLIDELKTLNPYDKASFSRLSFLIKSTLAERSISIANQALENILVEYPHYKNTKLVIYEHSLLEGNDIDIWIKNSQNLIVKLKNHFNIRSDIIDQEVEAVLQLQEALLPKNFVQNSKILPAISAWDEKEKQKDLTLLGTSAQSHAPWASLIIGTNKDGDRVMKKAFIQILHTNFRSEMTLPTLPEVLIGLLSFYFVFNIQYPAAYISFLRFLEKFVHGKLSPFSLKQRGKAEYKDFMAKFK